MQKSWYIVLNVSINSTEEEIKNAYKKLARKYHPDLMVNATELEKLSAQEKMKEINAAYEEALNYVSNTKKTYTSGNTGTYRSYGPFAYNKENYAYSDFFAELFREAFVGKSSDEELRRRRERIIREMNKQENSFRTTKKSPDSNPKEKSTEKSKPTTSDSFECDLDARKKELERYKVRAKLMQFYPFIPSDEYDEIIDEVIRQNRSSEDNYDDILNNNIKKKKR